MNILPGSIVYDENSTKYEVIEFIGNGSFGLVYKIKDQNNKLFALKTLLIPIYDHTTLKAFINEGNLATRIRHENAIRYYFFHDGLRFQTLPLYIIMEYAPGGTLENLIAQKKINKEFLSKDELLHSFHQLINGMEAINRELIHRDIKPDNILISNNVLKITDFGLSKVVTESTRNSTFKGEGCLPYLAPEGWKLETNTIQMDIYSMGFVFYELATLRHPLDPKTKDLQGWMDAHLFQSVKTANTINPAISPIINQVIMGMIEKKTNDRFKNWAEIREFLTKENFTLTPNSSLIDDILKKRLAKDSEIKEQQLQQMKRKIEIDELKKIIEYQFRNAILVPLDELIKEFNTKYKGEPIQYLRESFLSPIPFSFFITFPSGKTIDVEIRPVIPEDLHGEEIPKLNNRPIMAWGYLKDKENRGFNILLVKEDNQVYGTWYMLINRNRPSAGGIKRLEPFPFEFHEIQEELMNIGTIHIYCTEIKLMDANYLKTFVGEHV